MPADIIYEDEYALAFKDINPKAPIQILVIPKGEYSSFLDFSEQATPVIAQGFAKAIQYVIQSLGMQKDGFRLLSNYGIYGGQEVPHFHVHIFGGRPLGPMIAPE